MIKYIIVFILSAVIFLLLKAPASILQDKVPEFVLGGKLLSGSAWHEQYGTINWKFNSQFLLRGSIGFDISVSQSDTNLTTTAFVTLLGDKKITNTSGTLGLEYIKKFYAGLPQIATTNLLINTFDATLVSTEILLDNELQGEVVLGDTNIMGESIGDYIATISLQNKDIALNLISNEDSAFNININGTTEGNFINLKGSVKGNTEIATSLLQSLNIADTISYRYNLDMLK